MSVLHCLRMPSFMRTNQLTLRYTDSWEVTRVGTGLGGGFDVIAHSLAYSVAHI